MNDFFYNMNVEIKGFDYHEYALEIKQLMDDYNINDQLKDNTITMTYFNNKGSKKYILFNFSKVEVAYYNYHLV